MVFFPFQKQLGPMIAKSILTNQSVAGKIYWHACGACPFILQGAERLVGLIIAIAIIMVS